MTEPESNALPPAAETPPETPPAEPEAPAVSGEQAPAAQNEPPDPAALKAEIEELGKKRKQAEEDAIYWRKQKAEARADFFRGRDEHAPPAGTPTPPAGIGSEPVAADFDDYNGYVKALADHRVKVAKAEWDREAQRRQNEQSSRERMQALHAKLQDGFAKYNDFEEVAFDRTATHITPMIVDLLADCDSPADVAYYLAKNRVEGVAISRMTPIQAARAITKIEARLTGVPPAPQTKKISGAPPPINPIGSKSSGLTIDPDKMTPKEFAKWRESQGARRY